MAKWYKVSYQKTPIPEWVCLLWLVYPFLTIQVDESLHLSWLGMLLCVGGGYLVLHAVIAVHELGHVLAGCLVGIRIGTFLIGSAPKLAEFKVGQTVVTWNVYPAYGWVRPIPTSQLLSLSRSVFFLLGGIMAELMVVGWLWLAYQIPVVHDSVWSDPIARYLFATAALFLVVTILVAAWPGMHQIAGRPLPSDGLQVWHMWKFRRQLPAMERLFRDQQRHAELTAAGDHGGAEALAKAIMEDNAPDPTVLISVANLFQQFGDLAAARQCLELALLLVPADSPLRAQILDVLVTAVLNHGRTDWLQDADRWSTLALAENPDSVTLKGTRGSVLAELGLHAEARSLLQEVLLSTESPTDRGFCLAYLGWMEAKAGDYGSAEENLKKARGLNLNIPAIGRLDQAVTAMRDAAKRLA